MKGLLVKDFCYLGLNKKIYGIMAAIIVMALFLGGNSSAEFLSGFMTSYLAVMLGFQVIGSITLDEYRGGLRIILSMPVTRKEYVISKYIYAAVLTVIGGVAGYAISLAATLIVNGMGGFDIIESLAYIISALAACMVLNAILLPVQLKYGSDKGKMVIFVLVAAVLAAAFAAEKIGRTIGVDVDKVMNNIEIFFNGMNVTAAVLTGIIITGVVLCVSILISIRIVDNKEL